MKIRTKDIANLGQLYLQKGKWKEKQLLPTAWVQEATAMQTSNGSNPNNDWEQGYGYQFWRCRHNLYRGDGAFGQYCIVFPEQDAVLAITSGTSDMGAIMNLIWDKLLPELKENPIAENKDAYATLQSKLNSLTLSTVTGPVSSSFVKIISNKHYTLQSNEEGITGVVFNLKAQEPSITFSKSSKSFTIPFGNGVSKKGTYIIQTGEEVPVESSGAWISPNSLQVRIYLYETPFYYTYKITFDKNDITIIRNINVSFGPTTMPTLKGTRK